MSWVVVAIAAIAISLAGTEIELALEDVPQKVTDAALEAVPGIRLVAAEAEQEGGRLLYEVEGIAEGTLYEIELTADGEVIEVELDDDDSEDEDDDEDGDGHDADEYEDGDAPPPPPHMG
jgi:uncharacterized membrane protein YkoI